MAVNNKFMPQNGLFNNISVGDVQRSMNAEEAARINNSGRGAPNYYAQLIREAGQKQVETVEKLAKTLGGMLPGPDASAGFANLTDFLPGLKQDSRLNKAVKIEKDKKEIMKVLGEFKSNDGVISEDEMRQGFSLLMSKGYSKEAQDFLTMAQNEGLLKSKQVAAAKTSGSGTVKESLVFKNKDGYYQTLTYTDASGNASQRMVPLMGAPKFNSETGGKSIPVDTRGQDFTNRVDFVRQTEGIKTTQTNLRNDYKTALKKSVDSAKATLDKRAAELAQKLDISKDMAIKRAGAELITEREHITSGSLATTALPQAEDLLSIAKSGNYKSGDAASAIKRFKRIFGIEGTDEAVFRQGTQMMLLKMLKPLMGAKATDQDLIELKEAFARPANSREANVVFLNDFISKAKKDIKAARYFSSDPEATLSGWFNKQDRFAQLGTIPTPEAQRRPGEMIRKGGDAYKWNGAFVGDTNGRWDKQ